MNRFLVTGVVLALAGIRAGAAEEPATPPKSPAGRQYSERVEMHAVPVEATPVAAEEKNPPALSTEGRAPPRLPDLFTPIDLLMSIPPPLPERPSKGTRQDRNWLRPSMLNVKTQDEIASEEERRESGWGWLADEVKERTDSLDKTQADGREDETEADAQDTARSDEGTGMMMQPSYDRRIADSVLREVGVRDAQELARVEDAGNPQAAEEEENGLLRTRVSALEDPSAPDRNRDRILSPRDPAMSWRDKDKDEPSLMPRTEALFSTPAPAGSDLPDLPKSAETPSVLVPGDSHPGTSVPAGFDWNSATRSASPLASASPGYGLAAPASSLGKVGGLFSSGPVAPPAFGAPPSPSFSSSSGFQAGKPADVLRPWGSMLPSATPSSSGTGAQY